MTILTKSYLRWCVYPLLQNSWARSASLVFVIIFVSLLASYSFSHIAYGVFSVVCLLISMARYFLPSYYTVDQRGLTCKLLWHKTFHEWSYFVRIEIRSHGVFLSPFVCPSRLDTFRGVFLPFNNNADFLLPFLKCHVQVKKK